MKKLQKIIHPSLLLLFALSFPKVGRASDPSPAETCAAINSMLLETQLQRPSMSPEEYARQNNALKDSFRRFCEGMNRSDRLIYPDGKPIFANGSFQLPDGRLFQPALFSDAASNAPILQPFLDAHRSCAPGCSYTSWGIWGDEAHQQRRSCHNSGQAIDIHAITCGGSTYVSMSSRFTSYVGCMRGHLGVIYNRGRGDHQDHAHFELHGCNMCAGLGCGGGRRGSVKDNNSRGGENQEEDSGSSEDDSHDDGDEDES